MAKPINRPALGPGSVKVALNIWDTLSEKIPDKPVTTTTFQILFIGACIVGAGAAIAREIHDKD